MLFYNLLSASASAVAETSDPIPLSIWPYSPAHFLVLKLIFMRNLAGELRWQRITPGGLGFFLLLLLFMGFILFFRDFFLVWFLGHWAKKVWQWQKERERNNWPRTIKTTPFPALCILGRIMWLWNCTFKEDGSLCRGISLIRQMSLEDLHW